MNEIKVDVTVVMKKKYSRTVREEQMGVLAHAVQGVEMPVTTSSWDSPRGMAREKRYVFNNAHDANVFLAYPTVQQAIMPQTVISYLNEQ